MIKKIQFSLVFCLFLFLWFQSVPCPAINTDSGPVFFIGEDIIHPKGMVITVNQINRKPATGGFGLGVGQAVKKDDLSINITLMNNGTSDRSISILNDFSLDLGIHHYNPIKDESSRFITDNINIAAGTQSRIDLNFKINQSENEVPELLFNFLDSEVRIVCDEKLGRIVTESQLDSSSKEDIAKAAKILIEAGRLTAAKSLCEPVLMRYPNDNQFLLLMAKIYNSVFDEEQTAYYLKKIKVANMSSADEAEEVALMAIDIGYSDVALNILASFDAAGLLSNQQKAILARAYYYENELQSALNILNKLFESGYANDPKAYLTMGNVYNKKYDNETAIYYWEKAIEINPDYSEALFNIGVGYYKLGDINKARSYWEKVISSNPDSTTLAAAKSALHDTSDW